jgi:endo-alpha-1,4-polygalactosaminidase (GH114 family)
MTTTAIHVNVYLDNKTIANYFTLTPKPSTVKRRSSRRQLVQSKRARLGLPVDGKVKPFMWSGETMKPTRKQSLEAALEADKMMKVYAQLGDAEDHRQYLIQSWLGWMG